MITYKCYIANPDYSWVTLVHGASADASIWDFQVSYFQGVYNILVLEFNGDNEGIPINDSSKFSFQYLAKEIVAILDKLRINRSHFIGMCLGNMIVRELMEEHKEKVGATVMTSAIVRFNLAFTMVLYTNLMLAKIIHYKILYRMMIYISTPFKATKPTRKHFLKNFNKVSKNGYELWLKLAKNNNIPIHFFNAIGLRSEVLFVSGGQDYLMLHNLKKFVKLNKLASLKVLPKGGHAVNIDKKELFNKEVHDYLKKTEEKEMYENNLIRFS